MASHYDVVVIGMQRAGLVSAALLARSGRRVLVLDHGENAATYRYKGLQLPLCPTLIPALDHSPHLQHLVKVLGIGPMLRKTMRGMRPAYQAILPDRRVDIPGSMEGVTKELAAEFPAFRAPINAFVQRLRALNDDVNSILREFPPVPPANMVERMRIARMRRNKPVLDEIFEDSILLEGVPTDHPLREILLGPFSFFSHLSSTRPTVFQAVRLLSCYFGGAVAFPDRVGGLSRFLWGVAEDAGTETALGSVVGQVELSGRKIVAVHTTAGARYTADYFIANTLSPFHDLLPAGKLQARFTADAQTVRPSAALLVLNLVVKREVIPVGMGEAVFLLNGRRQHRDGDLGDTPLFMRRYPAQTGKPGSSRGRESPPVDERYEILSIAAPAKLTDIRHSPERLASLRASMFERVSRVVPFLSDHIVDTSMPLDTASWDMEEGERRMDPLRAHQFFETQQSDPLWGVAGVQPATIIKNLVRTGCEVVPGLGVEGEYMSGLRAAEVLEKTAGKAWKSVN